MTEVLELIIDKSDAGDGITIKQYLKALLEKLWEEEEGFSGKRPFGNSGWSYDLYKPLVKSGLVVGDIDEDGYLGDFDSKTANKLIFAAIESL